LFIKLKTETPSKTPDTSGLSAAELLSVVEGLQRELAAKSAQAHWVIRLNNVFQPLINLMREVQNSSDYLQADGYSGYGQVCASNGLTRIGCWDHARRKYVEATKAGKLRGKGKPAKASKADVALSHISKLYAIERQIKDLSIQERYRIRQEMSLPRLEAFKTWLETQVGKVMKDSLTRKAMEYTLNQWPTLVGYCERGDLQISNGLEPSAYIQHVLERIAEADTLEKLELLLPWNAELRQASKKVSQFD